MMLNRSWARSQLIYQIILWSANDFMSGADIAVVSTVA